MDFLSDIFVTNLTIFFIAFLLLIGVLTAKFSTRSGLPSLVLFIILGMILSKFYYYDNAYLTQLFGTIALIVILFEGGMQTKWSNMRPVIVPSVSLATMGVVLTAVFVGVAAKYILDVSWLEGMLFGSIVGSTDAAATFSVLASKPISKKMTSLLEAESGLNDPMAIFLTISMVQLIQIQEINLFKQVFSFVWQMGFGLFIGLLVGKIAIWSINRINLDSSGLYPVFALSFAVLSFSVSALLNGSGLLAVYVTAVLIGNADINYGLSINRFNEGFVWIMHILMFVLLGLLVFPERLLNIAWQAMIICLILMFVARPVAVFLTTIFMKFTVQEKLLMSWAGLKGAVPIVLATYPLLAGMPNGQLFFEAVFFVVLTSTLIQGATITTVAGWLGLAKDPKPVSPHSLELVSLEKTNKRIIQVRLDGNTLLAGKRLSKLNLPSECLISVIIRGNRVITPRGSTTLEVGDILYVLTHKKNQEEIMARLTKKTSEEHTKNKTTQESEAIIHNERTSD